MIVGRQCIPRILLAAALLLPAGCKAPSPAPANEVSLPVPPGLEQPGRASAPATRPTAGRYLSANQARLDLTPIRVIHLAFELSPRIRAAYLKYAGEKARYDYIIATWTSTTPGLAAGPGWDRALDASDTITSRQTQKVEAFVERNFLDTSRLRAFTGVLNEDAGQAHAFHPTAGGLFRFPLWGSREALQRSSEQIFQQTRVHDAQLEYVQAVREHLTDIGCTFFAVLGIGQRVEYRGHQIDDLGAIERQARAAGKPAADLRRLQAEITTATTELRNQQCNYAIEKAWMTSSMGLPRDLDVQLVDGPFDPFEAASPEQLLAVSLRVDPEIATLNNAIQDAQVQLALARRGRLDVAMALGVSADLAGSGSWAGQTDCRADALLSVAFIDPRLSSSLACEASANVYQYQQAIQRRRNNVYLEAMEPMIRFRMLARNIPEQQQNVERLQRDYRAAVQDYLAGRMDVDDLVRRRQDLLEGQTNLSFSRSDLGIGMVSLAGATGRFFEMLSRPDAGHDAAAGGPQAPPATTRPAAQTQDAIAAERAEYVLKLMQEMRR